MWPMCAMPCPRRYLLWTHIVDDTDYYKNVVAESDIEDAMNCAEALGTVYTLPKFIHDFNWGKINLSDPNVSIRMAIFKNNQFVEEIK